MVGGLDHRQVTAIQCGLDHTIVLAAGQLFSCGWGADGQTGAYFFVSSSIPPYMHDSGELLAVTGPSTPSLAISIPTPLLTNIFS